MKKETAAKATKKDITYIIRAVIATGAYSNIQPEITITAGSLDEAQKIVLPHIEALYQKYHLFLEKATNPVPIESTKGTMIVSEACMKAQRAISTAHTAEALALIATRIENSVQLSDDEKRLLVKNLGDRAQEIKSK